MQEFIPFALHNLDETDIAEVVDTLRSNWITSGPKVKRFQDDFSKHLGVRHALAVNSGTAGLHLALESVGVGQGDKVITTPYTFTATAEVIRYLGADPLFVDICADDYNIDPQKIEHFICTQCSVGRGELVHKKSGAPIKAIMPVHIGGRPCVMQSISTIAQRYNLKVIEDAAHALPSFYNGSMIGTISDLTVFSFYATKSITTGEGGMVVTNRPDYFHRMQMMCSHGIDRSTWDRNAGTAPGWHYDVVEAGFKYNLSDIAASLGIQQLKKADAFYEARKRIATIYDNELREIVGLALPLADTNNSKSAWHLYMIKLNSTRCTRNEFIEKLHSRGIGTSVHFIPLHLHHFYRSKYGLRPDDFPVAYDCFQRSVSLPIYSRLTEEQVLRITGTIRKILA